MKNEIKLHPNNKHQEDYNFSKLIKKHPALKKFVFTNKHKKKTIDFSHPGAVRALNTALMLTHYPITYWKFPKENLCPPLPGRVDYIHYLADLIAASKIDKKVRILDIGTGASCIYPLLGNAVYKWKFVASDIDYHSLKSARIIVDKNELDAEIVLRHQKDKSLIFSGVVKKEERFQASMCNPPFFASQEEANKANAAKLKGLGKPDDHRNFSGNQNELWYHGGEKAFLHNYLYQSSLIKTQCFWFTTLVSKKENIKSMYASLKKLGATKIRTIPMQQGNKISRIIAWSFLTEKEQKEWQ